MDYLMGSLFSRYYKEDAHMNSQRPRVSAWFEKGENHSRA